MCSYFLFSSQALDSIPQYNTTKNFLVKNHASFWEKSPCKDLIASSSLCLNYGYCFLAMIEFIRVMLTQSQRFSTHCF
jgi:hypothetical protein